MDPARARCYRRVVKPLFLAPLVTVFGALTAPGCSDPLILPPCPEIALLGDIVAEVQASGTAPTPMGGVVADGTYVLTKDEAYPPVVVTDPPQRRNETIQLTGTELKARLVTDAFPEGHNATATFTTEGTQSTITWTCGSAGTFKQNYTATATELILMSPPALVSTFTKQ